MVGTPAGQLTSNRPTSYPLWLPTGRQVLSLLLAGCCATVLYARVYATFDRVRIMAVMTEQQAFEGAVVVPLPDVSRLAGLPTALILDLRNAAPDPRVVSVTLAGSELARILLDPGEDVRADLSLPADAGITRGDRLELEADGDRWSLRQLEIANSHGFSRGLFAFVIVPSPADQYQSPPAIVLLLVFIVLLGLPVSSFQRGGLNVARPVHLALAGCCALYLRYNADHRVRVTVQDPALRSSFPAVSGNHLLPRSTTFVRTRVSEVSLRQGHAGRGHVVSPPPRFGVAACGRPGRLHPRLPSRSSVVSPHRRVRFRLGPCQSNDVAVRHTGPARPRFDWPCPSRSCSHKLSVHAPSKTCCSRCW